MMCVGRGAYAEVWATDNFAYKCPYEWTYDWAHTVLREGLLMRQGYGPQLVGLCVKPCSNGYVGLAMQRAACTLDVAFWRAKQQGPDRAVAWLTGWAFDVLQQLHGLHHEALVHADVKPHNMLVMPDGKCRLSDFGLVRRLRTTNMIEAYTSVYRAPELCPPPGSGLLPATTEANAATDMWALSVTLFDVLTYKSSVGPTYWRHFDDVEAVKLQVPADLLEPAIQCGLFDLIVKGASTIQEQRPTASHAMSMLSVDVVSRNESWPWPVENRAANGCHEKPDFVVVNEWPDLDHIELTTFQMASAKTIATNVCNIVRRPIASIWPNASTLFAILARHDVGLSGRPYGAVILQATLATFLTLMVVIEQPQLPFDTMARLCDVTVLQFVDLLEESMTLAIQYGPLWANGLWP